MIKKLIPFLLLLLLLCSCVKEENGETPSYKLFYFNSDNTSEIVSTDVSLQSETPEDAIKQLFYLLSHPQDKSFRSPVPPSVHLLNFSLKDGLCSLTLSDSYRTLPPHKRVPLNFAIVSTMSSIPETDTVSITSKGKSEIFTADEFISLVPSTYHNTYTANLYYISEDRLGISKKSETIPLSPDESLEFSVLRLLIEETDEPGLVSPFPPGTVLNDVYLDGGTCIVDVSSEFVTNAPHTSEEAEAAVLFSVVNTLTELPKIDNVKFLIEGSAGYGFIYHNIAEPLTNSQKLLEHTNDRS